VWTADPTDTVTNDASAGTSSGIAIVWSPAASNPSRITREVLSGSGGTIEVCHHAVTVTPRGASSETRIDRGP